MKIEIVKEGISTMPRAEKPAEEPPTPAGETPEPVEEDSGKGSVIPAKVKKIAAISAGLALAVVIAAFGMKALEHSHRDHSVKRAAADDLYRRRVRAQLRLGPLRIRPELFGVTDWNMSFTSDEAKRWKRIALACENRRWAEAVPLLLGREPPPAQGPGGKKGLKAAATRPFPSAEEIDAARDVLAKELDGRSRTLAGIRAIVDGYCPAPTIHIADSAASAVVDVSVAGRGIAELRRDYEREDWLGLANRVMGRSREILPPLEDVREPLRNALATTSSFLVCRGSSTVEDVCVLFLPPEYGASPQVDRFRDKLPDGGGWMMPWDLRVREVFLLSLPLAEKFVAKFNELRIAEEKRLEDISSRFRLGLISEGEYARAKRTGIPVADAFLAWARSGDTEADARKKAAEAARNAFRALGAPNRIYANGMLAKANPKFVPVGEKGKQWKTMLGLYRTEDWNGLVALLAGEEGRRGAANAAAVREAGRQLSSFRLPVRMDGNADVLASEDGLWLVELIPDTSGIGTDEGFSGGLPVDILALSFADRPEHLERHPDGTGYIVEFPVARCEMAVFLGDWDTLDEEIEERNNQWRSGIRSIRKRLSLTEIDEATATGEAIKLANKLKREFVAWLGEN